jgi:hypothetical protein
MVYRLTAQGNREEEGGTFPHFTLHPDAPRVHLDELFGNAQSKSGAAEFPANA